MGLQGEFFEIVSSVDSLPIPAETSQEEHHAPEPVAVTAAKPMKRSMKDLSIPKLYYSISEVSRLTGLEQYVLRYWETEFDELRPQKNRAGNRIYSNKDIKFILRIKELLREQRYTIEGAKHILKEERIAEKEKPVEVAPPDPEQITMPTVELPSEAPVAESSRPPMPQAVLTLDEIRAMRASLEALRAVFAG